MREFLSEEFVVEPRFMGSELPLIRVRPADLFIYILNALAKPNRYDFERDLFVEVYGGTANAVVAADAEIDVNSPTDFDARFHVGGREQFDRCRYIVENYILEKLNETRVSPMEPMFTQDLVRRLYFQKQVTSLFDSADTNGIGS